MEIILPCCRAGRVPPVASQRVPLIMCRQRLLSFGGGEFRSEQLELDSELFLVNERENRRTAFTQPEMPYAVGACWRTRDRTAAGSSARINSKPEKFAALPPIEGDRTSWIRTLGIQILVQSGASQDLACPVERRVFTAIANRNSSLRL